MRRNNYHFDKMPSKHRYLIYKAGKFVSSLQSIFSIFTPKTFQIAKIHRFRIQKKEKKLLQFRFLCVSLLRKDDRLVSRFQLQGFLLPAQRRFCKLSVSLILLLLNHLPESFISFISFFIIFIMNIYVGNLSYRVKEADLQQVMEDYGTVTSCKVIMDRETGKSKGFGFVEIADDAAGAKAIAELNGAEYEGRTMVVKEARPRE